MVSVESLSAWMKENTVLSDSSIYKYAHAVKTISRQMREMGVIPVDLFEMSAMQYDIYLPIILRDPHFVEKNTVGNNMYSNALKQYRMYRAAVSEPSATQQEIEDAISGYSVLDETERSAIVKSRIGQGLFRKRLMEKYDSRCVITGVSMKKLLIASHIKPWAVSNNEERLSEENGILLTPTYDKLFDYGLITFTNQGRILISSQLSKDSCNKLHLSTDTAYDLRTSAKMIENLDYHRDIIFVRK